MEVKVSLNNESQFTSSCHIWKLRIPYCWKKCHWTLISTPYKTDELQHVLRWCLPNHLSELFDPLVHLLQFQKESSISSVKSPKQYIIIPTGVICHIKCSIDRNLINSRIPVTFEPGDVRIWEDIVLLQLTVKI